jgi:hypothetical protein
MRAAGAAGVLALVLAMIAPRPAAAFFHAGGWAGGGGHWAAADNGHWAAGGDGHYHSGTYGTTANGTHYATGSNGAVAVNNGHYVAAGPNGYAYGNHYVAGGTTYTAVHSPTVVNQYNTGCYNCGGWASTGAAVAAGVTGLAVGTAVGASVTAANAAAAAHPVYAPYVMGDVYAALPVGCAYSPYNGAAYYNCGGVWFSPYYGANGMYYRVVPVP